MLVSSVDYILPVFTNFYIQEFQEYKSNLVIQVRVQIYAF